MKQIAIATGAAVGLVGLLLLARTWAGRPEMSEETGKDAAGRSQQSAIATGKEQLATFGTGCFWCTEAVFDQLKGVKSVVSGYSGGNVADPTYEQICSGMTGHAEVVQIKYDADVISFAALLEAFWQSHDPTTPNRQGNDVGTQYRSAIFYHDEQQRREAERLKKELNESGAFRAPIVTEITPFERFYPAEKYHQDYFNQNPSQPYCATIIRPKVEKFRKVFKDRLKGASDRATARQP
jgi:peptide-methionine (S)-S-oxide reductase